jgi:Heterokaryon incompatibility protein (HET)
MYFLALLFPKTLFRQPGRELTLTAEDQISITKELGWLDRCRLHYSCGNWGSNPLPTRLIDVGESDARIRLVVPGKSRGQYLCLSHCWAGHQPLKSEKKALKELLERIPWDCLPKTFQEAISFTRALGSRYIWIDSLCILQDDNEDWIKESAQMEEVFKYSYLTLAATTGSDGSSGLYTERVERSNTTVLGHDSEYTVSARIPIDHASKWAPPKRTQRQFPLLSRAWVFQEQLLSSRVLHFGPHELVWEYQHEVLCECGKNKEIKSGKTYLSSTLAGVEEAPSHHRW